MDKLEIIGQEKVLFYLSEREKTGKLPNVMLFTGPSGVGKTTTAKKVAIDIIKDITENDIACVIEGQDTENIKFFNMSILKSDDEVKRVISNFTPAIYGKKVLILDECHGMNNQQQDALLIQLESLDKSIYVIMCTTDAYRLNDSLIGRVDVTLRFNALSKSELKRLCQKLCEEYNLQFSLNKQDAISKISLYSNGDARVLQKTMLELKNLETTITEEHLDAMLGDVGIIQPVTLLKMLSVNITQALEFTDKLVIDNTFRSRCAKLLALMNGTNEVISLSEQKLLNSLDTKLKELYFKFLCDILDDTTIDNPKLISLVYRYYEMSSSFNEFIVNERLVKNKGKVKDNFEDAIDVVEDKVERASLKINQEMENLKPKEIDYNMLEEVEDDNQQSEEIF